MTEDLTRQPDTASQSAEVSTTTAQPRRIKADMVIIGAGSGGLSAAAGAAMLGLKVVLYEKGEMGGDCLNSGCVPSKALLTAAKYAASARESADYGVMTGEPRTSWPQVKAHIQKAIDTIAPVDSQERFEDLGVTVIREHAHFTNPRTIASDNTIVTARRIVIATGSRAATPPVQGLSDISYLTNETIFDLPELPGHLIILGGGPIGMEMAQAFRRLGSDVTLIEMGRVLGSSDPEHAALAACKLREEGVTILESHKAAGVSTQDGQIILEAEGEDGAKTIRGTHLLVAAGRQPVTDGLTLEAGEVDFDKHGIKVSDKLRSISNDRVWALGDVAGKGQFTHLAGWQASVLVRRAFFKQGATSSSLPLPAVTYTSPEVAQVGLTEQAAREKYGENVAVTRFAFDENDRAIAEAKTDGECKLILRKGKLIGASIVGEGAGDIIQLVGYAMSNKMKLTSLTNFISPYPTRTEAVKRAASAHFTDTVFGKPARMLVNLLQRIP